MVSCLYVEKLLLVEDDLSTSVPCSAYVASIRYYPTVVYGLLEAESQARFGMSMLSDESVV
jgi:hypothetical protein